MTHLPAKVLRFLRNQGCTVQPNRRGHYLVVTPSGDKVWLPSTPSDVRSMKNSACQLRRAGLDVDWRQLVN